MRGAILRCLYDVPSFQVCRLAQQSRGRKILLEAVVHFGGYSGVCGFNLWRSTTLIFRSRSFLGRKARSESELWYLYHEFGASTRALDLYGSDPDGYRSELDRCISAITPGNLPHIFQDPASSQNSHLIFTIHPKEGSRSAFEKQFASQPVFDLVWKKHLSHRLDLMEQFYYLFLANPITAISAGRVFEERMHQLLRSEQTLRLFPILPRGGKTNVIFDKYTTSEAKNTPTEFQLTSSEEYHLVAGAELQENQYCRPESSNFAAVDSVLLIHPPGESPILFMFQMTRNKTKHDAKLSGLQKVEGLDLPLDTRKYLVIVTPEDIYPRITVPLEYFGGTVDIESEETEDADEGQDENMDVDQGKETDEDQDDAMDEGQDDATGRERWDRFKAFHCPIDIRRLFSS